MHPPKPVPDLNTIMGYSDETEYWEYLRANEDGILKSAAYVWNTGTLAWEKMIQPGGSGGGYETVWLKDIAGNKINPAKEDGNLSSIKIDVDKIPSDPAREGGNLATLTGKDFATQTTLALIKAKTDNLDVAISGIKTGTDKIPASPSTEGGNLASILTRQSDGTQKAINRGGAKGATAAADVTSTAEGTDHQAIDVQIYSGGTAKDPTAIRALTSSDIVTLAAAAAASSSPIGSISLGNSLGKTNVLKTGNLVTTTTTADQVILTYTVTAGKTFYLEYLMISARLTTFATTATFFGASSLENPSGTKLITIDCAGSGITAPPITVLFSEPIPIAAGTVIRVVCTPSSTTSYTWKANFGGYEK